MFDISVIHYSNGCPSPQQSTLITIIQCPELLFYVPNSFTPDGDEHNNSFKWTFTSGFDPYNFHIEIYNRWGEIIYESNDAQDYWDGTYANIPCTSGLYNYKVHFKSQKDDGKYEFVGSLESNFLLAATMNPCKCGYYNHEKISCTCSPVEIKRYQSKISGPILDRIDIKLNLDGISNNYTNDDKLYPNLDFRYIKKFITEKKKLKESLLGTSNLGKNNYIDTYNIIVQKYFPDKIYSLLLNELKNTTISDRSKIKLINLIFTICIFNNRDQITLEDVLEGLSLTFKKSYL
jgi:gliding motility-associated-like protein